MSWFKRDDSTPEGDAALPKRTNTKTRDELARAEEVRAKAREAEGSVGGRPGKETGGDWGTGDKGRDH